MSGEVSETRVSEDMRGLLESLRAHMLNESITQRELAQKLNKTQAWVSQVLNPKANPTLRTVMSVARALGVELKITSI